MLKNRVIALVAALAFTAAPALASGEAETEDVSFSFEGPFGTYDQAQLRRGLQVYTEVCSACHGLKYVAFRTLTDPLGPGLSEAEVKELASNFEVWDPELRDTREAKPVDKFPENTSAGAPDLSLMAKARAGFHGPAGLGINQLLFGMGGPEHIYSVLTGYTGEEKEEAGSTLYGNRAFPGGWISMPPPLSEDAVEYADGTPATVEQMAKDVAAFLMWTAEPKMVQRKKAGFVAVLLLGLLAVLLYLTNKELWRPIKRHEV
ncbi:MAG: cytochrome c1 [Alphaproteobacteria bacterium]|nr:MAG: cytochrome c1 [Alphaproteobacteria bacterium]